MTTPPDFGGLEIEEGAQEDLGAPAEKHRDPEDQGLGGPGGDDNEAHAPGEVCGLCGAVITSGQDVRRKADGTWVHEICPPGRTAAAAQSTA